ncbi:acyl-CoA dehydrogenase family protein [Nonomuraea sp. NPDC050783]|uniref:acyl-CoA dehydrogenase family protein n=1 Tax=Nonomuraea sp. NPDC050783 TaxID=3154634 RepID=UPI0034670C8C
MQHDVPAQARLDVGFRGPQLHGAYAQLLHAAIDVGTAGGALEEALLDRAAQAVDAARYDLTDETAAAASIAVAAAKAFADPVAMELGNAIFELGGTRSSLDGLNLHRHWRNARTHTLHDPARWKIQHIGRYVLDGKPPPRHGLLQERR